ncbi:SseB family protein [Micromonospora sp. URMC 103]|uniref:SseB family protein n=1 Tax=Micromonospora sp. URMC 103 TaxID=3423406 RepID=UPI003F1DCEC6
MTEWEPATEAEAAMRDALRAQDQERYFRILARTDLLLPVTQATAQAPAGWGTWTSGGRTHVLAFTSATALRTCLGEHAGSNRRLPYADLAAAWPNPEWWLAVNPGLPVEGYLPAWFVAQLSRGDVRLPGRTLGARARLERAESLARARASGAGRDASPAAGRPETGPPAAGLSGRAPFHGVDPAAKTPLAPDATGPASRVPAPAPAPAALPLRPGQSNPNRWPGEATPSGWPPPPADPARPAAGRDPNDLGRAAGAEQGRPGWSPPPPFAPPDAPRVGPGPTTGRPSSVRTGASEDAARATTGNGRTMAGGDASRAAGESGDPARRSFFEPASGRGASFRSPLRPADRATPPSRFGRSGQPFPRRGQDSEPTQAFFAPDREPTPAPRPPVDDAWPGAFPASGAETTQPLPRRRPTPDADEPTRPFGLTGSSGGSPGPGAAADTTQPPLGDRRTRAEDLDPVEELPPSIAEPVSAPPAPRRGFTPIVIEGTIVESRDLTDPAEDAPAPGPLGAAGSAAPGRFGAATSGRFGAEPTAADAPPGNGRAGADSWGDPAGGATTDAGADRWRDLRAGGAAAEPGADPWRDLRAGGATDAGGAPAGADPWGGSGAGGTATAGDAPAGSTGAGRGAETASDATDLWTPRSSRTRDTADMPDGSTVPGGPAANFFEPSSGGDDGTPAEPAAAAEPHAADTTDDRAACGADAPVAGGTETPTAGAAGSWVAGTGTGTPGAAGSWVAGTETGTPGVAGATGAWTARAGSGPEAGVRPEDPAADFQPANVVEEDLLGAAGARSTDTFLSTLLLARVLLPVAAASAPGSRPGDPGFVWRTEELDGETFVVVYTSPERLADHADGDIETVQVRFVQLIRRWPDTTWSFAVNPGTPVGAKLPGEQIVGLANWAAEVGLGDDAETEESPAPAEPAERPRPTPRPADPTRPVVMQKAVAPSQLAYYLERGYDRVSGFVHRANELNHLNTPAQLYDALGLNHPGSPFSRDADEIYVLRWPAYRPSLYRIPYGGQNEAAMRAMEGWVIERSPFRGNGFAPGESSDVVAEFKVDSARLPHGAQLWRIGVDGTERVVAVLDADTTRWREVEAP